VKKRNWKTFSPRPLSARQSWPFSDRRTRAQSEAEQIYKAKCAGCHAADEARIQGGQNTGAHDFRLPDTDKEPTLHWSRSSRKAGKDA